MISPTTWSKISLANATRKLKKRKRILFATIPVITVATAAASVGFISLFETPRCCCCCWPCWLYFFLSLFIYIRHRVRVLTCRQLDLLSPALSVFFLFPSSFNNLRMKLKCEEEKVMFRVKLKKAEIIHVHVFNSWMNEWNLSSSSVSRYYHDGG